MAGRGSGGHAGRRRRDLGFAAGLDLVVIRQSATARAAGEGDRDTESV